MHVLKPRYPKNPGSHHDIYFFQSCHNTKTIPLLNLLFLLLYLTWSIKVYYRVNIIDFVCEVINCFLYNFFVIWFTDIKLEPIKLNESINNLIL
jgi:hypothetical protein